MIRILLSTRLGERRMTQSELARATGIRSQTINELYHDFAERVSLDDLDLICEALDCELDDLIVREPNPERRVKEVRHIPQTVNKVGHSPYSFLHSWNALQWSSQVLQHLSHSG